MAADKLLQVQNLTKYFYKNEGILGQKKQIVRSVDNVSFDIYRKETLGLVGESGCGKTTVGRTITRLYKPTGGKILFDGEDISGLDSKGLLPYRKRIQMIFQDPYASLNPRMTVMDIIGEAGQKVVVIEDLISTGGSCIEVVEALREAGAEVLGVASIFTYGMQKGLDRMAAANVQNISLTDFDTIAQVAADENYIKNEDIAKLIAFRNNPSDESWIGGNK